MTRLSDGALDHLRRVADWPNLPGDRFEVRSVVGQGGMGTVYRAWDRTLEREVALKVLRPELSSLDWTRRLEREARILARLEHPGIVPVHDAGTLSDGRVFYLMRLITGQSLDQLPASTSLADRLRLFLRICETIEFAHSRGVIHRDLKPSNVMLGEFGAILVLDWGIARVKGLADEPATPTDAPLLPGDTGPGTVLGTPGFMAPEQVVGSSAQADERTDVFALGAILGHLTNGNGDSLRPLAAICARAMAPDSNRRYPTVNALAADLTRYLDGSPVEAYNERLTERLARVYTRYQVPILLVVAYLVMRLVFLVARRG